MGSAICRRLEAEEYSCIVTRTKEELDLTVQADVERFFEEERPEYVVLAAAKVGGILANNTYPAEFIYENVTIQNHVIHASWKTGVKRLLFLGSSCIYPRECPQPMKEEHLLTGPLELTNEPYAVAKIAGIKMCQSYNRQYGTQYLAIMPTNLYGPQDNYDLETSHVLPALIRKFHEAKIRLQRSSGAESVSVELWGTGTPMREFLYSDDLADASLFLLNLPETAYEKLIENGKTPLVNVGYGKDTSIKDLALLIQKIVGFEGDTVWDSSKPDGTPRKLLDVSRMTALGWQPKTPLKEGIRLSYEWCLANDLF